MCPESGMRSGWLRRPEESARIAEGLPKAWGSPPPGSGRGKVAETYLTYERVTGAECRLPGAQGIGDCVGWAFALGVSALLAEQAARGGGAGVWEGWAAPEPIYAGSRVEAGGGRLGPREDGSVGAWAAEWLSRRGGVLLARRYPGADLSRYDAVRARSWGARGVPDDLEPTARRRPVRAVTPVRTYAQARDALANGYPVVACSTRGFADRRDGEGFAAPRGRWAHAMCLIGLDDAHRRPGALCQNSWGPDWIGGPKRRGQPEGSFWIDAEVLDGMLGQGDSWALSDVEGFPARSVDHVLI